jgi:glutamate/gamma-aminobutyrate anti-porter
VAGIGFLGALLAFVLSFIPPSQIATGSNTVWFTVLILGCIIFVAIPLIIYSLRKPSWKDPNTEIQPFHWEVAPVTATTTNPATVTPTPVTTPAGTPQTNTSTGQTTIPPTLGAKENPTSQK